MPETCIQGKHTIPNQAFINAAKQKRNQKIYIFELNIVIIIIIIMTKHTIQSLPDKKQETANTSTILSELFAINPKTGKQAGDMRDLLRRLLLLSQSTKKFQTRACRKEIHKQKMQNRKSKQKMES